MILPVFPSILPLQPVAVVAQPTINVHIFCYKSNLSYCDFSFNRADLSSHIEKMND